MCLKLHLSDAVELFESHSENVVLRRRHASAERVEQIGTRLEQDQGPNCQR
jgi:hypothetical protein